jgi:hypothetical protein
MRNLSDRAIDNRTFGQQTSKIKSDTVESYIASFIRTMSTASEAQWK